MKQILEGYGYGIIQDCSGLLATLENEGFSKEDFLKFVEESKHKENIFIKKEKEKKEVNIEKRKPCNKNGKINFLKSGETELMEGVVCNKCGDKIYIEGICRSNPLVKEGYVRRGICGNCTNTFGIR